VSGRGDHASTWERRHSGNTVGDGGHPVFTLENVFILRSRFWGEPCRFLRGVGWSTGSSLSGEGELFLATNLLTTDGAVVVMRVRAIWVLSRCGLESVGWVRFDTSSYCRCLLHVFLSLTSNSFTSNRTGIVVRIGTIGILNRDREPLRSGGVPCRRARGR
jgi:hypothetical protein